MPADNAALKARTLENLLMWARNWKYDSSTFLCKVKIDKVKTKNGWNYPSSGGENVRRDEEDHSGLPTALANIVGTTHTLELKSHTYFKHGNYESFTCWKVVTAEDGEGGASSGTVAANEASKAFMLKRVSKTPSVATPSKSGEEGVEDSDAEESFVAESEPKQGDVVCSSDTRERKRVVLDDSE
ncbi:hypothetical protein Tco_1364330 [Tanacetum coccineum]